MNAPPDPRPMTERERLMLHLRLKEGLTMQEIGNRVGVSKQAVHQFLSKLDQVLRPVGAPNKALRALRKCIRCDLLALGIMDLQQVRESLEAGILHWNAELGRVCWKEHTVGFPGWETWEAIHWGLGLLCQGAPPGGEPPAERDGKG